MSDHGAGGLRWRRAVGGLCAVVLLLSSVACGFHPRGSITRLNDRGSIFVDASRNISIAKSVGEALEDAAFELADNRDDASILLRLSGEQQSERVVSVKSDGRVSELELSHAIEMLISASNDGQTPDGADDQAFNRVEVRREYTYDETGVLGKENEARILRTEMEDELVRQIVLRTVASLAPSVAEFSVDDPGRDLAPLDAANAVDDLVD